MMKRWEELALAYIAECRTCGLSNETLAGRESEILRFGRWLKRQSPRPKIEDINHDLLVQYIKGRTSFLSKSSTCGVISKLRVFGDYLVLHGLWRTNPLHWIKGPKLNTNYRKLPKNYKRVDLENIFKASFSAHNSYSRTIGPALISLMYTTGLRKSELLRLNTTDWDRRNLTLKIFGSKSGQDRLTPVSSVTWRCLEAYLQKREQILLEKNLQSEALFINQHGRRISGMTLASILKTSAKRAGVKKATAHMFRHSCASDLVEKGTPIHIVQKVLGHSVVMTTFRYLNVADPQRVEAMRVHPINQILGFTEDSHGSV